MSFWIFLTSPIWVPLGFAAGEALFWGTVGLAVRWTSRSDSSEDR